MPVTTSELARRLNLMELRVDELDAAVAGRTPLVWHFEVAGFVPNGTAAKLGLTYAPEPPDLLLLFIQGVYQPSPGMVFGNTVDLGWAPPTAMGAQQVTAVYPYNPDRVFESVPVLAACIDTEKKYPYEATDGVDLDENNDIAAALVALALA